MTFKDIRTIFNVQKSRLKYYFKERNISNSKFYSLNCYHYYKCIFVHVPKTAGVAVAEALFGNLAGGHKSIIEYQCIFKKEFDLYFKFSFVRNPWDRLHSAFYFLKNGGFGPLDRRWVIENEKYLDTFENFVLNWLNEQSIWSKIHFHPQYYFLVDSTGNIPLDFIGRFENLESDFWYIKKRLKISTDLKKINYSQKPSFYQEAYSKKMIEKINELYQRDIDTFHYSFS